jgi:hypothetical protein
MRIVLNDWLTKDKAGQQIYGRYGQPTSLQIQARRPTLCNTGHLTQNPARIATVKVMQGESAKNEIDTARPEWKTPGVGLDQGDFMPGWGRFPHNPKNRNLIIHRDHGHNLPAFLGLSNEMAPMIAESRGEIDHGYGGHIAQQSKENVFQGLPCSKKEV